MLPIHPASNEQPQLLDYDKGFETIDWETMELNKDEAENINLDLRYHKQVRMAECLSPLKIHVGCFQSINVPNEDVKRHIIGLLDTYKISNNDRPYIDI